MASTSAILRSAAATQRKIQALNDEEIKTEWDNSEQTYQDFKAYSAYLTKAAKSSSDPSSQLTYQNKIRNARRSFTSNELQRQQNAIMEGRATTTDKLDAVASLYKQAVDNGDANLAQNLASQYDSLSIKAQNEAQVAAGRMASNGMKDLNALVDHVTKSGAGFVQLPNGDVVKTLPQLNAELSASGGSANGQLFKEAFDTLTALQKVVYAAYQHAPTQEAVDAVTKKYGGLIEGSKTFNIAGKSLNLQQVELAYRSEAAGNPLYKIGSTRDELTGKLKYALTENKIGDFVYVRNDNGTVSQMNVRTSKPSQYQTLDTQITDQGYIVGGKGDGGPGNKGTAPIGDGQRVNLDTGMTIGNRLAAQGIDAQQNDNGTITITIPGQGSFQGVIGEDGNVRYYGQPGQYSNGQAGLYELNPLDTSGNAIREVDPQEISSFGIDSKFGGLISQPSAAGRNYINAYSGVTKNNLGLLHNAMITNPGMNDFTGSGMPVIDANLQGTSKVLQASAARKAAQPALQANAGPQQSSNIFNLNQTPVQQYTSHGQPIRQLAVARAAPTPQIRVAQPTAPPRVSVGRPATISAPKVDSHGVTSWNVSGGLQGIPL